MLLFSFLRFLDLTKPRLQRSAPPRALAGAPCGPDGHILEVTNTKESGRGSLQDAITQTGLELRSWSQGIITLNLNLVGSGEERSYLTGAGQTSPEGI